MPMTLRHVANVFEDGPSRVVGVIVPGGSSQVFVFEREDESWTPLCIVQDYGPNRAFPPCFSPRPELIEAMNQSYATRQPVDFEVEV